MLRRCAAARHCPVAASAACRKAFSTRAVATKVQDELATVLDRYRAKGLFGSFQSFTVSTLAVVQLRKEVPGFGIPGLKEDAAALFCGVGEALADADKRRLQQLTTPMCYSTMSASLRSRPLGEKHSYRAFDAVASVKQMRVGHHASNPGRRFAQATCIINAKVVWTITDAKGKLVGSVGTENEPFDLSDYWVFERLISGEGSDSGSWRLKVRLEMPTDEKKKT